MHDSEFNGIGKAAEANYRKLSKKEISTKTQSKDVNYPSPNHAIV
jgi:hypothetical protein